MNFIRQSPAQETRGRGIVRPRHCNYSSYQRCSLLVWLAKPDAHICSFLMRFVNVGDKHCPSGDYHVGVFVGQIVAQFKDQLPPLFSVGLNDLGVVQLANLLRLPAAVVAGRFAKIAPRHQLVRIHNQNAVAVEAQLPVPGFVTDIARRRFPPAAPLP